MSKWEDSTYLAGRAADKGQPWGGIDAILGDEKFQLFVLEHDWARL